MSQPEGTLPAATLRLFDGYDEHQLATSEANNFLIGRLLEEGDSTDLAWLAATVGRAALRHWVEERGERQLSRRSCLFWQRVFGLSAPVEAEPSRCAREALWPH